MSWIKMENKKPLNNQKVFYYFEPVGVHAGFYKEVESALSVMEVLKIDEPFLMDVFYSEYGGFLTDDVTHWMARNGKEPKPNKPEVIE